MVFECTEGDRFIPVNNRIFLSASEIDYRDTNGKSNIIPVITNGNDTYFECDSVINLFRLNFVYLNKNSKLVTDRFNRTYIHYNSIREVLEDMGNQDKYEIPTLVLHRAALNNRIDRNEIIECITRGLKMISNIGGYSLWRKLK